MHMRIPHVVSEKPTVCSGALLTDHVFPLLTPYKIIFSETRMQDDCHIAFLQVLSPGDSVGYYTVVEPSSWTAGCWLARRLHQLKASTTMDLGISIFLIFVRCVALRNLELLIKTGWNVFVRFVAENAGRG